MKSVRLLLRPAALVLCAVALCFTVSCMQSPAFSTTAKTTAKTTAPTESDGAREACLALAQLLETYSPSRAQTELRYDSPAVGEPLVAETELTVGDGRLRFSYSYDRLNAIGAGSFTVRETGELVGTPSELGDALEELYLWGVGASGVLLLDLTLSPESFSAMSLTGNCFTARVKGGCIADVFGGDLGGAEDAELSIVYCDAALSSLHIAYRLGDADVSVEIAFY